MKFSRFSQILQNIEDLSSRNEMTQQLAKLLQSLSDKEIAPALYLMQGRVVPRYVPLEFNVAGKLLARALARAFGITLDEVENLSKSIGDLGLVAESKCSRIQSLLTILEVHKRLYKIALLKGKGSQDSKIHEIAGLMRDCDRLSCKYISRIIIGQLRLGVSDKSILDALSIVMVGDKSKRELLDKAYGARSDIGFIAKEALTDDVRILENVRIVSGIPVAAMLCERESSIEKTFKRSKDWIIQPKYDGLRCQVHFCSKGFNYSISERREDRLFKDGDGNVKIFSRNLEDLTEMFPDIKQSVPRLGVDSIVLDAEAIGYDVKTGKHLSFQGTIQRRRKYQIAAMAKTVPVRLFVFDILYLNGKDLSELRFDERMKILKDILGKQDSSKVIQLVPVSKIKSSNDFDKLFEEWVGKGMEGVIVKNPESKYYPAKRGFDWIKFKKSMKKGFVDEIDAVILGYYRGKGARARFGIGAILVGVFNRRNSQLESIAKVGTGMKDSEWPVIKRRLDKIVSDKRPKNVDVVKGLRPDVWVSPEVVVVIEADEISRSSNHRAGFTEGKGYSLRFPRLKLFDRKDKGSEDITTVKEIRRLYRLQAKE